MNLTKTALFLIAAVAATALAVPAVSALGNPQTCTEDHVLGGAIVASPGWIVAPEPDSVRYDAQNSQGKVPADVLAYATCLQG